MTLDLFDQPDPLQQRFEAYHAEHPEVYRWLREMAFAAVRRGRTRVGVKALYEVLRWKRNVEAGDDGFKLDNSYTALYARKLMNENPELRGLFETRKRKAA